MPQPSGATPRLLPTLRAGEVGEGPVGPDRTWRGPQGRLPSQIPGSWVSHQEATTLICQSRGLKGPFIGAPTCRQKPNPLAWSQGPVTSPHTENSHFLPSPSL